MPEYSLIPTDHLINSLVVYHRYPGKLNLMNNTALMKSIRANGPFDPVDLFELNGQLNVFRGVRVFQICRDLGLGTIQGRVHEISEVEVVLRIAADVCTAKEKSVFAKLRALLNLQEVMKVNKGCELAKYSGMSPASVSKIIFLGASIKKELLDRAEELHIGSEYLYNIASCPASEHARLIEESVVIRCKDFIKTVATPRGKTSKKICKQDSYVATLPSGIKLVLRLAKNSVAADALKSILEFINTAQVLNSKGVEKLKEIIPAVLLELRLRERGNANAA